MKTGFLKPGVFETGCFWNRVFSVFMNGCYDELSTGFCHTRNLVFVCMKTGFFRNWKRVFPSWLNPFWKRVFVDIWKRVFWNQVFLKTGVCQNGCLQYSWMGVITNQKRVFVIHETWCLCAWKLVFLRIENGFFRRGRTRFENGCFQYSWMGVITN